MDYAWVTIMNDDMQKRENINKLLEIYGELLTLQQRKICEDYYVYNLSLAEIAQAKNISRSGVLDSLKKSEKKLLSFEGNLKFLENKEKQLILLSQIKTATGVEKEKLIGKLERMIKDGI